MDEYVITWEAPVIEKPEFRLYYDDKGKVLSYTCEKLEGNYIVIDAQTYAEMRYDIRIVEGKIVSERSALFISRLYPDDEGIMTEMEDISIIAETNGQHWMLKTINIM